MNKDITLESLDFEFKDYSNNDIPKLRSLCYRSKERTRDGIWLEIVFELEDKEVHAYRCSMNGIEKHRVVLQCLYFKLYVINAKI